MTYTQKLSNVLASLIASDAHANPVIYEKVCKYVMNHALAFPSHQEDFSDAVTTAGEVLLANACTTPAALNTIGDIVNAYPWDRSFVATKPGQLRRGAVS